MKKVRSEYGIKKWNFTKRENNFSSVLDIKFPDTFKLGKNRFTVNVLPNKLLKGSDIYVDIIDALGNPVYYEISSLVNDDNTRNVVVYIYKDTPIGISKIYVAATLKGSADELITTSNYLAVFEVGINPTEQVTGKLVLKDTPTVTFKEKLQPVTMPIVSSRLVEVRNASGSFSTVGGTIPKQLLTDNLNIERSVSDTVSTNPSLLGTSAQTNELSLPSFTDFSLLVARNFEFSSSMKGGSIELNNIEIQYPKNAVNTSSFYNITYTASIIEVVSTGSIKIYPPFGKTINYVTDTGTNQTIRADRFFNHTNFTCSYYQYSTVSQSATTQSFATFDITNIEPEFGSVNSIDVSYKPANAFGEFRPIGQFKLSPVNLFTDPNSVLFDNDKGLIEKPVGNFRNVRSATDDDTDFGRYWLVSSGGNADVNKGSLVESLKLSGSGEYYLTPKIQYAITSSKNTEYELKFNSKTDGTGKLDIYLTGSSDIVVLGDRPKTDNISTNLSNLGTYVGSVEANRGTFSENKFEFKTATAGTIRPLLLIKTGSWVVSDLEILPTHQTGFSGNQTRLQIPLENVESKTELLLKVQYRNINGEPANKETLLKGVIFEGNKPEITYPSQSLLSNGDVYLWTHLQFDRVSFNNFGLADNIKYPIFKTKTNEAYSGNGFTVGLAITVTTSILGITGSLTNPINSYQWASMLQTRATVIPDVNADRPYLYNFVAHSGSSYNQIGTFGNGHGTAPNLDSWYRIGSITVDDDSLSIGYQLTSTSSFFWDGFVSTKIEVQKYEYRH